MDKSLHEKHIQFIIDDSRILFIGVPRDNDMQQLQLLLREKGIAILVLRENSGFLYQLLSADSPTATYIHL